MRSRLRRRTLLDGTRGGSHGEAENRRGHVVALPRRGASGEPDAADPNWRKHVNKKIIASAAGLAAAASLVGGGTFASWTDNYTDEDNAVGAGFIELSITDPDATQQFDKLNMFPGGQADYEFVVTSLASDASLPTLPKADIALRIQELLGIEDGETTNSEGDVDPDTTPGTDPNGSANLFGEFDDQATLVVNVSAPGAPGSVCSAAAGNVYSGTLRAAAGTPVDLTPGATVVNPGQGVCVRMAVGLPASANDASQGDDAQFDVRFDLTQVLP